MSNWDYGMAGMGGMGGVGDWGDVMGGVVELGGGWFFCQQSNIVLFSIKLNLQNPPSSPSRPLDNLTNKFNSILEIFCSFTAMYYLHKMQLFKLS